MSSSSCLEFPWSAQFCGPLLGRGGGGEDEDCDEEFDYQYEYDEEDDDYLDYCNSNKIVEMTIRRDFLLLKLQELVDAETPHQAQAAIAAMNRETGSDEQLLKFLVRAGTFEIILKRLLDESAKKAVEKEEDHGVYCPDESNDAAAAASTTSTDSSRAGEPILSPSVAQPLLKKLSFYHEQRRLKFLEKKKRRMNWTSIVGIS